MLPTEPALWQGSNNFAPRVAFAYDVTGKGRPSSAADGDCSMTHFLRTCSSATCPGTASSARARPIPGWAPSARYRQRRHRPQYRSGVVALAAGISGVFRIRSRGDFFAVDPQMRTPYIQNFNLNVQQQLGTRPCCRLDTSARRGQSCSSSTISISPARRKSPLRIWPAFRTRQTAVYCPSGYGVPRTSHPNFFYLNQEQSSANSIYHALQVSLRTSGWHGLTSQANFVWSHSIDTASDLEDFEPNQAQPQNSTESQRETAETPASTSAVASPGTSPTSSQDGWSSVEAEKRLGLRWSRQPAGRTALASEL